MGTEPAAAPQAQDEELVQAYIHERFVELFLSQNARAQWSLIGAAAIIYLIWGTQAGGSAALLWLLTVCCFAAWRLHCSEALVRSHGGRHAPGKVALLMGGGGFLMALSVMGFGPMDDLTQAAVSIILLTVATGSVISTAGYRNVFLGYALPTLLPLSLAWATAPREDGTALTHLGVAVLILLFLGFLVSVARQQSQVFEEVCRIRFAERKLNAQLQRALENESEAHRAKTHFLAAASHDLRQPIHSMNVLVAALSMRNLDERAREIANLLGTVNQTFATQLDALLDISRLDAGTVKPVRSLQHLDRLVTEHFHLMEATARSKGLRCSLQVDSAVLVWTDPALLLRIISNLTDNAIKYNRRDGHVRLKVWREDAQACLSVIDTGIGIADAEHQMVFREFYQVGNAERDRSKGLGLGLSIVQRLAALLDVQIGLVSAEGQGTVVTLRMPLAAPASGPSAEGGIASLQPASAGAELTGPWPALHGLQVLVVDDDPQVRQSMQLLLTEVGCQVHVAAGTVQACDIARGQRLDVLLSDLRLQAGDDGLQVLQAVRALQPGLRAALITGETAPEPLRQAQAAGVPVLHKPVTLDVLRTVLVPSPTDPVAA